MTEVLEKTGLVLEGGGMRGIFTAGVLDVWMEEGIFFDGVIGVSAGAVHGSSFVSRQPGRSIRYYKKYCNDRRFMSYWNLIRTGDVADAKFCYHDLPDIWDPYDYEAFKNSNTEFYATCTNVVTGKAEYLRIHDMKKQVDILRASASLPYVSRIVKTEDLELLDGGLADSIPVQAFRRMGFTKTVVVLTRQKGYIKPPEKIRLAKVMYRKYPNFIETTRCRHLMYNETLKRIEQLEAAGDIFVIRPEQPPEIDRIEKDPEKLQKLYDIGRQEAENQLQDLKTWLKIQKNR